MFYATPRLPRALLHTLSVLHREFERDPTKGGQSRPVYKTEATFLGVVMPLSNKDWQQPEDFRKKFLQIPKHKQDDTVWNTCYFALEPLADATLDEVCANLKQQVFEYINLLRE